MLAFGVRIRERVYLIPAAAVLAVTGAVTVLARSPSMQGAAGQSEEEARRRTEREAAALNTAQPPHPP